jgi:L-threonylcarbamoyladenylate synthase
LDEDAEALERAGALVYRLGGDVNSVARHLYAGMRWLDAQGVDLILARDVGVGGLGLAIRDRLSRAATRVVTAER